MAVLFLLPCLCVSFSITPPSVRRFAAGPAAALNVSSYPPVHQTLWQVIKENEGVFSLLHNYIKLAPDIEAQLQNLASEVTFFAPENVAFGRLSTEQLALFESDISAHLKYHLLPRVVLEKDMHDGAQEATEQGSYVFITVQGSQRDIWINDAYILDGDHLVENGAPPPFLPISLLLASPSILNAVTPAAFFARCAHSQNRNQVVFTLSTRCCYLTNRGAVSCRNGAARMPSCSIAPRPAMICRPLCLHFKFVSSAAVKIKSLNAPPQSPTVKHSPQRPHLHPAQIARQLLLHVLLHHAASTAREQCLEVRVTPPQTASIQVDKAAAAAIARQYIFLKHNDPARFQRRFEANEQGH
jgi:uncharacterized surface protein with fasciclin (FAS1) repeats